MRPSFVRQPWHRSSSPRTWKSGAKLSRRMCCGQRCWLVALSSRLMTAATTASARDASARRPRQPGQHVWDYVVRPRFVLHGVVELGHLRQSPDCERIDVRALWAVTSVKWRPSKKFYQWSQAQMQASALRSFDAYILSRGVSVLEANATGSSLPLESCLRQTGSKTDVLRVGRDHRWQVWIENFVPEVFGQTRFYLPERCVGRWGPGETRQFGACVSLCRFGSCFGSANSANFGMNSRR